MTKIKTKMGKVKRVNKVRNAEKTLASRMEANITV